jgi:hypothetical protein
MRALHALIMKLPGYGKLSKCILCMVSLSTYNKAGLPSSLFLFHVLFLFF